jgi:chloride channel protein, CIC family
MVDDSKLVRKNIGSVFLIAIVIGVLAGIFSWLFRLLIGFIHNFAFLGQFSSHYDANVHTAGSPLGWLIIFVPVIGGLFVVYLIKNFAPMAKGHGVPEVMNAIYHNRGLIPGNVSIVKALASAITIGTGGALGREGPIVQISAAFSSVIGKLTNVPVNQRNLFIACGASAGIAATFNAPLGGMLFAIELLLVTVNSSTILPVAISTVVGANLGKYLIEDKPAFALPAAPDALVNDQVMSTLFAIPLGVMVGLLALFFIKSIYFSEDFFDKLPLNVYLKHIIGTFVLGCLFYAIFLKSGHYYVQGVGYATIQDVLWNLIEDPVFLLFLLMSKLIATGLTIGSGGSGGVFSPSLFLGAVAGAFFGQIVVGFFPELGLNPIIFVMAGMAAMVSGTTSAPLTAAIMVYEMTQHYDAILPIMAAVGVAFAVRYHFSVGDIYTLKLNRRGQYIPEGMTTDIKSHIQIDDVMQTSLNFQDETDGLSGNEGVVCLLVDDRVNRVVDLLSHPANHAVIGAEIGQTDFVVIEAGMTIAQTVLLFSHCPSGVGIVSSTGDLDRTSIVGTITAAELIKVIGDASRILR